MDTSHVGGILKSVNSKVEEPGFEDIMSTLESIVLPSDSITLSGNLIFPKSYLNRFGFKVDLYGRVTEGTHEYDLNYRFFDSNADFYFEDGKSSKGSPYDLIENFEITSTSSTARPFSKLCWVHHYHRVITQFFTSINPGETNIKTNAHYINRMGFMVSIDVNGYSKCADVYQDTHGLVYTPLCRFKKNQESMHDLVYEIDDLPLFLRSDWSRERIRSSNFDIDDGPENFDPGVSDPVARKRDFFMMALYLHEESKKLGINYTYSVHNISSAPAE